MYSPDGKRLLKCWKSDLRSYSIKKGTKVICDKAFWGYRSLESIEIPNSVTEIGARAFEGCGSLQSIEIPKGTTEKFKKLIGSRWWNKLQEK